MNQKFSAKLAAPKSQFQDVAVLAFPAPRNDTDTLAARAPRLSCTPAVANAAQLADGKLDTAVELPLDQGGKGASVTVDLELDAPLTARTVEVIPSNEPFGAEAELLAQDESGKFQTVRKFKCDRSNMGPGVGFMPRGPVTISFPATTSRHFRLVFSGFFGRGKRVELAEINLTGAARLERFIEKQLAKMHPTPLPMWDAYLWPTQPEPDAANAVVPAGAVKNLSAQLAADGTVNWDVPPGEWVIQRIGMTPTGARNGPASSEGQGLEVDKMNRDLAKFHFEQFIGEVLKRVPAAERKSFKRVVADSYETGSENWTDDFDATFRQACGYDPRPWLPVLSGRLVGSADQSERFLWDLRRLVADRVAEDYVGGLRDACQPNGLQLWLENYGHWGFPGEFLKYGGESDLVGGEYWVTGDLGSIECRAASSAANVYGKPFVSAEAFTGGPAFQNAPRALKARGDWSFSEGVNHFVLHVYIQQPSDKMPGMNAWFGSEFNRHNTWFDAGKAWVDYLRRSCWLLQQGHRAVDVAYFIGEDAPKMTGVREPALPPGHDFDYVNGEVIRERVTVKKGLLTIPDGPSYRVLVLPELETMRPELLRKIRHLVKAGATVLGPRPTRSPSMANYPKCDDEVRGLAAELWGAATPDKSGERTVGKGRVIWGESLEQVFAAQKLAPDFQSDTPLRFTHRRSGGTDIYFVANPKPEAVSATVTLRAGSRAPELWRPDTGRIERPAVYDVAGPVVHLPLVLGPTESVFVVFRDPAAKPAQRIVSVSAAGRTLLSAAPPRDAQRETLRDAVNDFTVAVWANPTAETTLSAEAVQGISSIMSSARNEVFPAAHGESYRGVKAAGCGLAVGNNGVTVLEHGGGYFVPTLTLATNLGGWTHVTVCYRGGQPHLYLNGQFARVGLKSDHNVHLPTDTGSGGFGGQAGGVQRFDRALSDADVAALVQSMPLPGASPAGAEVQLVHSSRGAVEASVRQPGGYRLQFADGRSKTLAVEALPAAIPLESAWQVAFAPGWGAPESVTFDSLVDWTRRPETEIQHFSGKVTYRKRFVVPESALRDSRVTARLALGDVRDLAVVRLNGKPLRTLWLAPWEVDVTAALRAGENLLEVDVINPWNNRIVGDLKLPEAARRTLLSTATIKAGAPLLSAGLLGPVQVRFEARIQIK